MAKSDDKRARQSAEVVERFKPAPQAQLVLLAKTTDVVRQLVRDSELALPIGDRFAHYENKYKGKGVIDLAAAMVGVEDAKEYLEEVLKYANAEYDCLRMKMIPDAADAAGLDSPIAVAGLGRVQLTPDAFVAVKADSKEALYGWFRNNKLSDLIQENINPSTLKAWVKDRIKALKPYPKDLLTVTPITRASIVRIKQ